jgi:hypothetical protein
MPFAESFQFPDGLYLDFLPQNLEGLMRNHDHLVLVEFVAHMQDKQVCAGLFRQNDNVISRGARPMHQHSRSKQDVVELFHYPVPSSPGLGANKVPCSFLFLVICMKITKPTNRMPMPSVIKVGQ